MPDLVKFMFNSIHNKKLKILTVINDLLLPFMCSLHKKSFLLIYTLGVITKKVT